MRICEVCRRCYSDLVDQCTDNQHPELSATHSGAPEMIVGYRLEYLLSLSGPVERYRAKQIASNRDCAVTILSLSDSETKRVLDEAKIAASIISPYIANIYDSGLLDTGDAYYVAEASDGKTLRDLLNESPIPQLLTSIQIVRQTAEAIDILHSNELIHGAVRPENILLAADANGQFCVRLQNPDLGAAIRHSIISNKFAIDSAIDSLHYFAPEQYSSDANMRQTDVYALGTVFYELLAGSPPFHATSAAELIDKQRNEQPPEIRIANFDLRMLLANTLMESLQKQPGLRLSSALAFARQMRHIEQLATHSPTPPPAMSVPVIQKKAAAATASVQAPVIGAGIIKDRPVNRVETGTIKDLPVNQVEAGIVKDQPVRRVKTSEIPSDLPAPFHASAELAPGTNAFLAKSDDPTIQRATANEPDDDSNRFRLRNWKEKFTKSVEKFSQGYASSPRTLSIVNPESTAERSKLSPRDRKEIGTFETKTERKRIKVAWTQPEDDLPSMDDVRNLLLSEPIATEAKTKAEAISDTIAVPSTVSEPKATRIQPSSSKKRAQVLTLGLLSSLEERSEKRGSMRTAIDLPIFAAYDHAAPPRSIDRRLVAGGFAVAIVFGALFGLSFLNREQVHSAGNDPELSVQGTEQTVQPRSQRIEAVETLEVPNEKVLNTDYAVVREVARDLKTTTAKIVRNDPDTKTSSDTFRSTISKRGSDKPDAVSGPIKAAVTPSTLVIYSANGKVNKRVEASDTSTGQRTSTKSGTGSTRPRIVANPKP